MRREGATPTGRAEPALTLSVVELDAQEVIGLPERQVLSRASAYLIPLLGAALAANLLSNGWVPDPDSLVSQDSEGPAEPTPTTFTNIADTHNAAIARNVLAPGSLTVAHQVQYAPVDQTPTAPDAPVPPDHDAPSDG